MTKFAKIIKTTVLVLDQCNTLSFAALVDPLRAANRQAGQKLYDWQFVTPTTDDVELTSGLRVPGAPIARVTRCDLLLIVAGFDVAAQSTPTLCASVSRLARQTAAVAGVDGGPWVMAQSGLLDGHRATVHWEDFEAFAMSYPQVLSTNARYVYCGNRMTSAGAAPTLDMMLHRIELDHSAALASKVAGSFVIDHRPAAEGPQLRQPLGLRHSHIVSRAHEIMENTLDAPIPLAELGKTLGLSPRGLQLQFKSALGITAQQHYLTLRLVEAQRQVIQTPHSVQDIALATGFTSQSSFSRAFFRAFRVCARDMRRQNKPQQNATT